jgi:hypothetical protein
LLSAYASRQRAFVISLFSFIFFRGTKFQLEAAMIIGTNNNEHQDITALWWMSGEDRANLKKPVPLPQHSLCDRRFEP